MPNPRQREIINFVGIIVWLMFMGIILGTDYKSAPATDINKGIYAEADEFKLS